MSNPLGPDMVVCPSCGHQVSGNVPACGNCGYQLSGPHMSSSMADSGNQRARFVVIVAVLAGIGALIWAGSGWIGNLIDDATVDVPDINLPDPDDFTGGGGGGSQQVNGPYKNVKELAAALNKGGLRCTQVESDAVNGTVATGSCQAPGEAVRTHVQINIYFSRPSLQSAEQIMSRRAFNYVHDENWFVVTQLPTARKVHDILGGKLVKAK